MRSAWQGGIRVDSLGIVLGDQPHLRRETLRKHRVCASQADKICQPSWRGRPRHPVVLPKVIFARLKDSREETLKQFLQNKRIGRGSARTGRSRPDLDLDTPRTIRRRFVASRETLDLLARREFEAPNRGPARRTPVRTVFCVRGQASCRKSRRSIRMVLVSTRAKDG